MNNLNLKSAFISAVIAYVLAVSAFLGSFFIPLMDDVELQANLTLMIAIIPASIFGANLYYKKGYLTNGFILGSFMFIVTMLLDAIITVPLFVIPNGGSHIEFFTDPGFWLIAVEYILVVAIFWKVKKLGGSIGNTSPMESI